MESQNAALAHSMNLIMPLLFYTLQYVLHQSRGMPLRPTIRRVQLLDQLLVTCKNGCFSEQCHLLQICENIINLILSSIEIQITQNKFAVKFKSILQSPSNQWPQPVLNKNISTQCKKLSIHIYIYNKYKPIQYCMDYSESVQEQLSCSVCMCLFKNPVTIECGHTFCRLCLLNYIRAKHACPICRTSLTHVSEHPHQDETLNNIVEFIRNKESKILGKKESKTIQIVMDHFENLLLLDIRCNDLLLPFTKVVGTFQLQSPALVSKLQRFVARQQIPFNKYGVVSKITCLNQLRYNVYECTIEGKSFCEINDEQIEKKSDQSEEYFYRVCQAKIIYEYDEIDACLLQKFLQKFNEIRNKSLLQKIYKSIDHQKLYSKTNLIASFYSVVKISAESNQKKYQVVTSFNHETRQNFIKEFLAKVNYDVGKNPYRFVSVKVDNGMKRQGFVLLIVFFLIAFLVALNSEDPPPTHL